MIEKYTTSTSSDGITTTTKTPSALEELIKKDKPQNQINLPRTTSESYFNGDKPGRMAKVYDRLGENLTGEITADNKNKYTSSAVKDLSECYPYLNMLLH